MQLQNEEILKVGRGNLLFISWQIVTHCQYSCSYCHFHPYESNTNYPDVMKMVLSRLEKINEPMEISLLGGEPTLHPNFHELVATLHAMDHIKKIDVVTNFHQPAEFWEPLIPYADKLEIAASFHVEFAPKNFFKKIELLKNKFNISIHFLLHHDLKYLPKLKEAAEDMLKLELDQIAITFNKIIDDSKKGTEYFPYNDETLNFMKHLETQVKKQKQPETILIKTQNHEVELTQIEFVNKNLNHFKGWNCQMNAITVHADGFVTYPCTNQRKHILFADLEKRKLVCSHETCPCPTFWNYTKTK